MNLINNSLVDKLGKISLSSNLPLISQNYMSNFKKPGHVILKIKKSNKKNEKVIFNTTNKVLFGPLLEKSSVREVKQKELNKKPLPLDFHKKYSDIRCLPVVPSDQKSFYLNEQRTDLNSENTDKLKTENKNSPFSLSNNVLINYFSLFNSEKSTNNFLNENDNIFNIKMFDGSYQKLPSVTHILQKTMSLQSKMVLKKWEENMIKKLGEEGFQAYKQGIFEKGKLFHNCIEKNLRKEEIIEDNLVHIKQCWKSVKIVLERINDVKLLESRVIHPHLQYNGIVDCVGFYRDNPVIIDFKTSTRLKSNLSHTYDNPLQLAAYLGALNFDPAYEALPNISSALLIIAYDSGMPAHIHHISKEECLKYWKLWCERLSQFKSMSDSET